MKLTYGNPNRRISQTHTNHNTPIDLPILKDIDQPFVYNIKYFNRPYSFRIYDCDGPDEWRLLQPDIVILCFDIGVRDSLEGLKTKVCILLMFWIFCLKKY